MNPNANLIDTTIFTKYNYTFGRLSCLLTMQIIPLIIITGLQALFRESIKSSIPEMIFISFIQIIAIIAMYILTGDLKQHYDEIYVKSEGKRAIILSVICICTSLIGSVIHIITDKIAITHAGDGLAAIWIGSYCYFETIMVIKDFVKEQEHQELAIMEVQRDIDPFEDIMRVESETEHKAKQMDDDQLLMRHALLTEDCFELFMMHLCKEVLMGTLLGYAELTNFMNIYIFSEHVADIRYDGLYKQRSIYLPLIWGFIRIYS